MPERSQLSTSRAIKSQDVSGDRSAWVELEWLYEARHRLVHEITHEQIGHYALRDTVHISYAVKLGRLVHGCMREVEGIITTHAPSDFPNLLDLRGYPISEVERLIGDIKACEARVMALASVKSDEATGSGLDASLLTRAIETGQQHVGAELAWLREFRPAGWRYHNPADDLEVSLLRSRLAYLREAEETLLAT